MLPCGRGGSSLRGFLCRSSLNPRRPAGAAPPGSTTTLSLSGSPRSEVNFKAQHCIAVKNRVMGLCVCGWVKNCQFVLLKLVVLDCRRGWPALCTMHNESKMGEKREKIALKFHSAAEIQALTKTKRGNKCPKMLQHSCAHCKPRTSVFI